MTPARTAEALFGPADALHHRLDADAARRMEAPDSPAELRASLRMWGRALLAAAAFWAAVAALWMGGT